MQHILICLIKSLDHFKVNNIMAHMTLYYFVKILLKDMRYSL